MHKWQWKYKLSSSLVLLFGALAFGFSLAVPNAHFRLNASHSLPQTLFLAVPSHFPFEKGKIISFNHPDLMIPVGKILLGIPGDRISVKKGDSSETILCLNDEEIGTIKTVSKSGKTYTPIHEGIIEEGCYFVYAPHPDSFDSRYAEFGLVKEEWITEVLWPIF